MVAVLYPVVAREQEGIQSGGHLHFVAPVLGTSPKADARLVPGAGEDGGFALGTIDREEVQWLVVGIGQADGDDDVSGTDVECVAERLLNPELFQLHFAAFLHFLFPFARLLEFLFVRAAAAAMLKLDFR